MMLAKTFIVTLTTAMLYNVAVHHLFQQVDANGSIIQWIVQQAGMGGIAALALVMLNRVWKERVEAEKTHAGEINQLRAETLSALNRNVEVITRLTEKLE